MNNVFIDWSKAPEGTTHAYMGAGLDWPNGLPNDDAAWERHEDGEFAEWWGEDGGWQAGGRTPGDMSLRIARPPVEPESAAVFIDWSKAPEGTTHAYVGSPVEWGDGEPDDAAAWERHEGGDFKEWFGENEGWQNSGNAPIDMSLRIARPPVEPESATVFIDWSKAPEGTTHAYARNAPDWIDGKPKLSSHWEKHTGRHVYGWMKTNRWEIKREASHVFKGNCIARPTREELDAFAGGSPAEQRVRQAATTNGETSPAGGDALMRAMLGIPPMAAPSPVDTPSVDPQYIRLTAVLDMAYRQAAHGKGKERHAGDLPFEDQPMQQISQLLKSDKGMAFQAIKKLREGLELPTTERKINELLGAINYIAGIVVYLQDREVQS